MLTQTHPIAQTLLALLDNQVQRTHVALTDLPADALDREPGHDCNTIRRILAHLLMLRRFQLLLLESSRAGDVPVPGDAEVNGLTLDDFRSHIDVSTTLLHEAILEHDPADWTAVPETPRDGKWGELPTLERVVRPFNDFTNHLGGIRAVRRVFGCGQDQTQ